MNSKNLISMLTGKRLIFVFVAIVLFGAIISCSDDDTDNDPAREVNFDRAALLQNLADSVIVPDYNRLTSAVFVLKTTILSFHETPSLSNLGFAKAAFEASYRAWQRVNFYNFGPATEGAPLNEAYNSYPVDEALVLSNASSGVKSVDAPENYSAKGFPALDYLLYGLAASDELILQRFVEDTLLSYHMGIIATDLEGGMTNVANGWDKLYVASFVKQDGTDATSSVSLLTNELIRHFEQRLRDQKFGFPLGKSPKANGEAQPDAVEGRYSELSVGLARENLIAMKKLYRGHGDLEDESVGLDDYLQAFEVTKEGEPLAGLIENQFSNTIESLRLLPRPLHRTVANNPSRVASVYEQLVQQASYLRDDMAATFGVSLTFRDGEGG